jgi:hypothetical protein
LNGGVLAEESTICAVGGSLGGDGSASGSANAQGANANAARTAKAPITAVPRMTFGRRISALSLGEIRGRFTVRVDGQDIGMVTVRYVVDSYLPGGQRIKNELITESFPLMSSRSRTREFTVEHKLHDALEPKRVNRINARREFFYASPDEILPLLKSTVGELVEYTVTPEAEEYRLSLGTPDTTL